MGFEAVPVKDMLLVKCPEEIDEIAAKELKVYWPKWVEQSTKALVFDFGNVTVISPDAYKHFVDLKNALEKNKNASLLVINMPREIWKQLNGDGMDSVLTRLKT